MTKRPEPNHLVMLNLFQHLVCFFLLSADASFIPVHRKGFSDAILIDDLSTAHKVGERREIVMKGEILKQYTEARIKERLHLFLQFPDLRRSFQEIDRKDLAFEKAPMSLREEHDKPKYSLHLLLLRAAYHRIIEARILKNLLKSLKPI